MTNTTVLPDQIDESAESGVQSPVPTHAASRDDLGAALLRMQGEQVQTPNAGTLNGAHETTDTADTGHSDPQSADASNRDDQADTDEALPRRGGSSIRELRDQVEQLKAQIVQPQQPAQPTEPTEPSDDPVSKAEATIAELRGSDEDWKDLKARVVDGLSFEDAERYRRMQVARDFEDEYLSLADARSASRDREYQSGFFSRLAEHFQKVSTKQGIDPDFVQSNPDMGAVFDHIYEAGRKDLADENERLRGQLKNALANGLTTAPRLPNGGGRTSLGLSERPDPRESPPTDTIEAGLRQRSGARR